MRAIAYAAIGILTLTADPAPRRAGSRVSHSRQCLRYIDLAWLSGYRTAGGSLDS